MNKKIIPKDQLIMGFHAVKEVLVHAPERLLHVFLEKTQEKGRKSEVEELCIKEKIPLTYTSFRSLTEMVESESHQSVVAHVKGRNFVDLKSFFREVEKKEKSFVLMLDQIFDPQNLGSLLRSSECFGVDAVVFSKNRGSDITPTATKSSCGASELIPLIRVSNLAEAVSLFQEEGFDAVATLLNPSSESLFDFKFSDKTLLIMGSEGEGIQPLICKRANRSIYIPMQGHIESLNVAQACAVLLYAAAAQNSGFK